MGNYINKIENQYLPAKGKVEVLKSFGAKVIEQKDVLVGDICVVDNIMFEAAAFLKNRRELEAFMDPTDNRKKTYLRWDKAEQYAD